MGVPAQAEAAQAPKEGAGSASPGHTEPGVPARPAARGPRPPTAWPHRTDTLHSPPEAQHSRGPTPRQADSGNPHAPPSTSVFLSGARQAKGTRTPHSLSNSLPLLSGRELNWPCEAEPCALPEGSQTGPPGRRHHVRGHRLRAPPGGCISPGPIPSSAQRCSQAGAEAAQLRWRFGAVWRTCPGTATLSPSFLSLLDSDTPPHPLVKARDRGARAFSTHPPWPPAGDPGPPRPCPLAPEAG